MWLLAILKIWRLKAIDRKSENDILIPSITIMIENLKDIVAETNQLSEAAIDGDILTSAVRLRNSRESTEKSWKASTNQTLDAVIEPIKEASLCIKGNVLRKPECPHDRKL